MLTIQIQDETLARQLQTIAEREDRPVEDVLKAMVAQYPVRPEVRPQESPEDIAESIRQVYRKAYNKARAYWESVGDTVRAAMTDAELDEQFGAFDEEGIPRFKSELPPEPPVGSLAYAAKIIEEQGGVITGGTLDASRSDEILNEEFADYLLKRMNGEDGDQ
jgi:hypothetical protein